MYLQRLSQRTIGFAQRQTHDFKLMLGRRALHGVTIISLVRGLFAIPAPLVGGLIWEHIGPQYVFIAAIAIDAFVRLPLLSLVRETLNLSLSPECT